MGEDKPRLARLTAIITHLQSRRRVTAREIAEKHSVSIRTVYRDIRTLERSGIPVITEEGKGYSLLEGYHLPPVMFSEEEVMALLTAEHLIKKNKDQSLVRCFESASIKLKSVLKTGQKGKTEFLFGRIQVRNNSEDEKTSHYLIQLQSTIANFQVVEIKYRSLSNYLSKREVEPFALYTTKENWIMIAFCREKQDFRAFRLDCIESLSITAKIFEPHKITLEQYLQECRKKWEYTPDIPLSPGPATFASNQKNNAMQYVEIEPFNLIGISIRTTNQDGQAASEIGKLWTDFLSQNILAKIPGKVDDTIYSLYTDYEGDHTKPYSAILGCKVKSLDHVPKGMRGKSFAGGRYLKLSTRGDLTNGLIVSQWTKIWEMKLDRIYTADFEVFGEKARNPVDAEVDFYVAVKR